MELEEMLEQTNDTENVETQTTEEMVEGIEETDTTDLVEETKEEIQSTKTLRELLRENPIYQEEYNDMIKDRLSKKDRQYKRDLAKYQDIENVLKATLGGNSTEEVRINLRNAYSNDGIELPEYNVGLSNEEIEVLAMHEVESIVSDGYETMVEEANRLADKKYDNLSYKEKIIFTNLANRINEENDRKELLSIGASESLFKDKEFEKFRKQFNSNVSIKDVYALYKLKQPKKEISNPGSMKNVKVAEPKTIFTDDDIAKMTDEELDKYYDAIRAYQTREK